jgi:hypothetical protein
MNQTTLVRICDTREAAHAAAQALYAQGQVLISSGKRARMTVEEQVDDRSIQQNKFYWAACLPEISDQASIAGQKYAVDAWHELFKRQFLGYEVVKVRVAGRKRATVIRRLRSTTKLKVRPMSRFLDEVQAFAAADLGVRFSVRNWQEYQA